MDHRWNTPGHPPEVEGFADENGFWQHDQWACTLCNGLDDAPVWVHEFPVCYRCTDVIMNVAWSRSSGEFLTWPNPERRVKGTVRKQMPAKLRRTVHERDAYRCRYCGGFDALAVDHVLPLCQGGTDDLANLVSACQSCNSAKGGRTPEQAGMPLRDLPTGP